MSRHIQEFDAEPRLHRAIADSFDTYIDKYDGRDPHGQVEER